MTGAAGTSGPGSGGRRWPHVALGVWSALIVALLIWPAYDLLGNRVEPYVFGLPLAFAWNAILAVATFVVLCGYYLVTEERD
jgi:hypothetical protein